MINVIEDFNIISHKQGGITLQTGKYVHHFPEKIEDDFNACGTDLLSYRVSDLLRGRSSVRWENNEMEKRVVIRKFEDQWYDSEDIILMMSSNVTPQQEMHISFFLGRTTLNFFKKLYSIMESYND